MVLPVEKLRPELHGAGGDPAEVAHAPAHTGARLDDHNAPPPGPSAASRADAARSPARPAPTTTTAASAGGAIPAP